jgi:hypothetical protein
MELGADTMNDAETLSAIIRYTHISENYSL